METMTDIRPTAADPMELLIARDLELKTARGQRGIMQDLPEAARAYLLRSLPGFISSHRESISDIERALAALPEQRAALDDVLYLSGESDTHPFLHGSTEVIEAADLSGRHIGMKLRSITYRDVRPGTAPSPEQTYKLRTLHFQTGGLVHINGGFMYLRRDTPVTVMTMPGA